MSQSKPIEITEANFAELVLNSQKPAIVYFWHEHCGPCRTVAPKVDRLAAEYGHLLPICKSNTRQWSGAADHFELFGVPTILFLSSGKIVHHIHGGKEPQELLKVLTEELLAGAAPAPVSDEAVAAKHELDATISAAKSECERLVAEAQTEFNRPFLAEKAALDLLSKPFIDECKRRCADEEARHARGEITVDDMQRTYRRVNDEVRAEGFDKSNAEWLVGFKKLQEAQKPYEPELNRQIAAAESAYEDAIRVAREKYHAGLAG